MADLIIAFAAGAISGILALLWHQRSVTQAVNAEKRRGRAENNQLADENRQLREDIDALQRCRDSRDSYWQGVEDGKQQQQHKDNVTRFADSFQNTGRGTVYVSGDRR